MMKRVWATGAAALLLAACGGKDTRTPVALDHLVGPTSAPWFTVEQSTFDVPVRGADESVVLNPQPPIPEVLQAQLREALQPAYFTDLIVGCSRVKLEMRVDNGDDDDNAPSKVGLDLSLQCRIDARGFITTHDYRVHPDMPVPAGADYKKALVTLLDAGARDIAGRLTNDVEASRRH